ncbi:putative 1-phosphatidylinositol-3-phosphate 5-kinase FAB1C [Andrographis paniculata]|uniref:putative 1-phosphatidylinositol-3-phosphate 5-kinase FAB1C n=1 Tax=Andrographis paniculata TaxID=175694 RepID=UPI0021E6FED2|nr:putative 1-phosphatidylinositol-3-phosphate 5-kinase FAB1C [Andrographis paniculata]
MSCGLDMSHMTDNNLSICSYCGLNFTNSCNKYRCWSCGRLLCSKCVLDSAALEAAILGEIMVGIGSCKFCFRLDHGTKSGQKFCDKVYPSESLRRLEQLLPSFSGERVDDYSPGALSRSSDESCSDHPSPVPVSASPRRYNDSEEEDAIAANFFSTSSEYTHNTSDGDFASDIARDGFCGYTATGLSTSDTPSNIHFTSSSIGQYVQQEDLESRRTQIYGPFSQQTLDFETNSLIWLPPPPHDLSLETNLFTYDDENDEVGGSCAIFSSSDDLSSILLEKEKQHVDLKESLRTVVSGHFKVLVLELLQAQGIPSEENCYEDWLNIVTSIAWQAASFIKPDTNKGGSMDPCEYVKVKCVALGQCSESKLVKGVVCTKNIKHKRMISKYKNTRLLLLGGALEYQQDPNQLASFGTLLQQEHENLKIAVAKIEAHRPNVLLVEKTVSLFAQNLLLAKEISLVLNVKRSLLERLARCSGATITQLADHLSAARIGHCEHFHLEKILEEHEPANQSNKRPLKTLMYFEGCPRRLGCTVLLRGASHEELKKVKKVVQYAVFAAYNLLLETSFLADEGATLPNLEVKSSHFTAEHVTYDKTVPFPDSVETTAYREAVPLMNAESVDQNSKLSLPQSLNELEEVGYDDSSVPYLFRYTEEVYKACEEKLGHHSVVDDTKHACPSINIQSPMEPEDQAPGHSGEISGLAVAQGADDTNTTIEYSPTNGNNQNILVSFSCHRILNGDVCERSRLLRIKFYGSSDKPLGRYLRNLLDKSTHCPSCKELADAHSISYTHQQGNLVISVKSLPSVKLPGEQDGKIWMWHRCLRCTPVEGVPPATHRVVMSDAAWGLSFGKFLQLNFSTHATGSLVASCGHSLQRDCLWFYGFGNMVACFRYSSINILKVKLPPSVLEFRHPGEQSWIRREASEALSTAESLYAKILAALQKIKSKSWSSMQEFSDASNFHGRILELNHILEKEKKYYKDMLCLDDKGNRDQDQAEVDILEINKLRHSLLIALFDWGRHLDLLNSLRSSNLKSLSDTGSNDPETCLKDHSGDSNEGRPEFALDTQAKCAGRPFAPARVYSFDSLQWLLERNIKVLSHASHLLPFQYFHASEDCNYLLRDTASNPSPVALSESEKLSNGSAALIPSVSILPKGACFMVQDGTVITVYDDEPTSIILSALCSKEHYSLDGENYSSEDALNTHYTDLNRFHLRVSFEDEFLTASGNSRFYVTCYFAKQFDCLRRRCCPSKVDFIRSMSRCKKWSAQGGKSNVYFAKSFDERLVIKQVTKTELNSFCEFAPKYFKYFDESLNHGSPTCLAKILGMYQVTVRNLKSGKERKMDFMVMENLFFERNISRVYDLKGSTRSRYNSDTTGANEVLLDMNLLESLHTNPIFLGSKSKRNLERAIWNDTSFLASVDVMDYSLLVGVDEDRKELVVGIIDILRQYTWDKHLETWVKAAGILGGQKNASPTIISPKQYKKRFRKAMTTYFLTVPDNYWS